MIPGNSLNLLAPTGTYIAPDDILREDLLEDFELGSATLNDPTGGLRQTTWRAYTNEKNIYVSKLSGGSPTLVTTTSIIPNEINLAFDSNMRPQIAYVETVDETSVVKFYWYDTAIGGFTTTTYSDIYSPRLCLDDKRDLESAARDILFFYIKKGETEKLCYRQQRDRYTIERELMNVPEYTVKLGRTGMSNINRVQIEFRIKKPK